jgi:hypothetical protein
MHTVYIYIFKNKITFQVTQWLVVLAYVMQLMVQFPEQLLFLIIIYELIYNIQSHTFYEFDGLNMTSYTNMNLFNV